AAVGKHLRQGRHQAVEAQCGAGGGGVEDFHAAVEYRRMPLHQLGGRPPSSHLNAPTSRDLGFSLIEVMVVVAIISILALMAVPSLQGKYIRENIAEAMPLA